MRGIACDCTGLIVGILHDNGVDLDVKYDYDAFWYLKKDHQEKMLPYLEKYFYRVETLKPGDLISYRFGRSNFAHISMYLENDKIIHCHADFGVEIVNRKELEDRETSFWRLKDVNF